MNYENTSRIAMAIIMADSIANKYARRIKSGYTCGDGEFLTDTEVIGWDMNVANALSPLYNYWEKKDSASKSHSNGIDGDTYAEAIDTAYKIAKDAVVNVLRALGEIHGRTLRVNKGMVDAFAEQSWRFVTTTVGKAADVADDLKTVRNNIKAGGTAEELAAMEETKAELSTVLSELRKGYDSGENHQSMATKSQFMLNLQLELCKYAKHEYAKTLAQVQEEEKKKKEHAKANAKKNRQKNRQKKTEEAEQTATTTEVAAA